MPDNLFSNCLSTSSTSSSSGESLHDHHRELLHTAVILGYWFEPRWESGSASDGSADIGVEQNMSIELEEDSPVRLDNLD